MQRRLVEGNIFSQFFLGYCYKILKIGSKKLIEVEDLFQTEKTYRYEHNNFSLRKYLCTVPKSRKLLWLIVGFSKKYILLGILLESLSILIELIVPYMFKELVFQMNLSDQPKST